MKHIENCIVLIFVLLTVQTVVCADDNINAALHIDFSNSMFSRLDEEGKKVLQEYAGVYPKIKHFYGNIRMDVTEKDYRYTADETQLTYIPLNTPPILEREELFEVRYNTRDGDTRDGGYARVDSQIKYLSVPENLLGRMIAPKSFSRNINLITPESGYVLTKSNAKKPFYSLTAKRGHDRFMSSIGIKVLEFDTAPFAAGPMELENLFFRPPFFAKNNYFVLSARYIENKEEGKMVELISCIDTPPLTNLWTVRLFRENWVVKDVLHQGDIIQNKYWQRFQCVYNGELEGMPLLSSYQQNYGDYDTDASESERLKQRIQYEITNLVPGPVALSEFDVAQFLPPNTKIGEITYTPFSIYRIAAIAFGIVLVILGIAMRIRFIIIEARKQQQKGE